MPPIAQRQSYNITFDPPPWFAPSIANAIGKRPYLYQGELPSMQSRAIISSRLKHPLYEQLPWFAALKECLTQASQQTQLVLTTPQTTTHEFIQAQQQKLAFTLGTIHCYSNPTKWAAIINKPTFSLSAPYDVLVGPVLNATTTANKNKLSNRAALRDRILIASANIIDVLQLRNNSLCAPLLHNKPTDHVRYLEVKTSTTKAVKLKPLNSTRAIVLPDWFIRKNYLGHWTRDCDGPWPGETRQYWINQLLDELPQSNHSALNTLRHIIELETLTGASRTIHGELPLTCFTRVSITQWAANHVYRSHLQRWDFCPYGLLINRDWLQTQGLRPVSYGTQQQYNTLSINDRAYFQINEGSIDWRVEQEERIAGDLDLHRATFNDIIFFTAHQEEALQLQASCRWPVLSLDELCRDKLPTPNIAKRQLRGTL
jgi:hypothetical protein